MLNSKLTQVLCAAAVAGFVATPAASADPMPADQAVHHGDHADHGQIHPNPTDPDRVRAGARAGDAADPSHQGPRAKDATRMRDQRVHLADRTYLALATSPSLRTSSLDVTAQGDVITVSGVVPTEAAKQRALYLAGATKGVKSVVDQIRVDRSMAGADVDVMADQSLAEKVAGAIAAKFPDSEASKEWAYGWEIEHDEWSIDVDADLGYVFLEGTVPTWPAARLAVDTARKVPGVVGVDQRLRVGSPKSHDRQAVGYGFDEDAEWYDHPREQAGDAPQPEQ